jgi:adenylate cyclase
MSASVSSLLQSSGRQRIIEAVVAVLALVALWLLSFTPQWRQLEFKTFDAYTALAARGPGDTPVVIIAIDEPSFRELGLHWPFPRRTHAELIERAASDGALVIAFDLLFAEATNAADDGRMADAIPAMSCWPRRAKSHRPRLAASGRWSNRCRRWSKPVPVRAK